MDSATLIEKLTTRIQEERLAYRVASSNGYDPSPHAGRADGFSEVLEILGEPFDPLAGKPWLW